MPWKELGLRQYRKPSFQYTKIDWENPLSKGLVIAYLFNEMGGLTSHNYAIPGRYDTTLSTVNIDWIGQGLNFNDGEYCSSLITDTILPFDGSDRFRNGTVIIRTKYKTAISTSRGILSVGDTPLSGTPSFIFQNNGGTFRFYVPGPGYWGDYTWGINTRLTITLVNDGTNFIEYIDGKYVAYTAQGTGSGSRDYFYIASGFQVSDNDNLEIDYAYMWNRALNASEITEIYRNPFQVFNPSQYNNKYFFTVSGGSSIPVIMDHYRRMRSI